MREYVYLFELDSVRKTDEEIYQYKELKKKIKEKKKKKTKKKRKKEEKNNTEKV